MTHKIAQIGVGITVTSRKSVTEKAVLFLNFVTGKYLVIDQHSLGHLHSFSSAKAEWVKKMEEESIKCTFSFQKITPQNVIEN